MGQATGRRPDGRLALGSALIVLGGAALALQLAGIDLARQLGGSGWTLFVIVPGLLLLLGAILFPAAGLGLAIAGSITTVTGLLLLYQDRNDHYESWAYAWALLAPGAVGVGHVLHGLRTRQREMTVNGGRMIAAAAVIFVIGALFFESLFDRGRIPFDVGDAWPWLLVVGGAVLVLLSLVGSGPARDRPRSEESPSDRRAQEDRPPEEPGGTPSA
jgi:hypothetical protein